ncbi:hypothetical protein OEZ85_000085 [Tetradesmus obliquus]|uniref:Tyrosine-protein kinase ephrin type A/B receptor-like domain-containing protein n=1 Tax=Tetradesmus obliquus TaxID=3088 RepID=A0ABY8URM6_TETOB|nr:hypothetical protein OEZ85_000085 [Tetradesmus obliquus]
MRSLAHVAVVLLQLAGCAVAAAWQSPVTEPLLRRQLRVIKPQAGTCPEGCELESVSPGSCVFDGTSGGMLCKFCKLTTGRVAAADGSCGCKPGFYLEAGECKLCPKGSYCLGGTADLSVPTVCGHNLSTINFGTRDSKDCVTTAGFSLGTVDGKLVAVACPVNTFNSGKNRLTACVPCPAGLTTGGATQRVSISGCLLPPGWQGTSLYKAVRCPRGEYRAGDAAFSVSVRCSKCPTGTNTQRSTSTASTDCNLLLPGWRWKSASLQVQYSLDQPAEKCPFHSYCEGVVAPANTDGSTPCPNSLWTKATGAKLLRNCLIPIGHYVPAGGSVTPCPTTPGSYQPSWLSPTDAAAGACLPCGSGVLSEPVAVAELATIPPPGGGAQLAQVAGPSSSCYIRRGQGLVIDSSATRLTGALAFRAVTCSSGSYGISAKKNGLTRSRCKDCPFGTVTTSAGCTNNPGTAGTECPDSNTGGFYSIDACRYTTGATCGNIRATSGTNVSFVCTSPLKYNASKDQELIQGMNQTVASDTCCVTAYATGATCANSNITCTGQTKLVNTDVVGLVTSEAVTKCCKPVYAANTMCSTALNNITCGDNQTLVDTAINGKTVLEAMDMCCKPNCKNVTCASGTAKNDTTPIPAGQAPASVCCNTCASYTCTNSKLIKSTTGPAAGQEPTDDICCAFPTGSNCDNVDGNSSTADPFSCGASLAAPKPAPGNIPLVNVLPSAASTSCCVTSCSAHTCASGVKKNPVVNVDGIDPTQCCETCAGYSCTAPTALRSTLPQLNQGQGPTDELCCAYRSGATCGDADGPTLSAAGRLVCSGGGQITVDLTTTIENESPAGAQTKCCTTTSSTCAGYSCPGGSVVKDPQLSAQTLTADLCCAYPDSAKCGDIDGSNSTATVPLVCSNGVPSNPATTTIAGQSPASAQTTCCAVYPLNSNCDDVDGKSETVGQYSCGTTPFALKGQPASRSLAGVDPGSASTTCCITSCSAYTCTSGVKITPAQDVDGVDPTKCCSTCAGYSCPAPTTLRSMLPQLPAGQAPTDNLCCAYPSDATCGDADGPTLPTASAAAVALACSGGKTNSAGASTTIGNRSPTQAQDICCTTPLSTCASYSCPQPTERKPLQTGQTLSDDLCCAYPDSAKCGDIDGSKSTDTVPLVCSNGVPSIPALTTIAGQSPANAQTTCCAAYPDNASCGDVDGLAATTTDSLVCDAGNLVGSPKSVQIAGKTPAYAQSTCCTTTTTTTTSCQTYTCSSGELKSGPPSFSGTVTLTDALCCNTCDSINCGAPTSQRLANNVWPKGTPSAAVCCGYPTGANCGDVVGSGTGAAFTCTTGLIPASPTTPLAGELASAADSKCCLAVYPADATCADIYGTKQAGGTSYNCLTASLNKNPDATTVTTPINGMAPSAASKKCCTTSCQDYVCGTINPLSPTRTYSGIVTREDAMCCQV